MITVIIVFILLIAAVYYILMPFMSDKALLRSTGSSHEDEYSAGELKKINLLRQIKEVEFEHEIGIIDPDDFHRVKGELMNETREVMETLETEKPSSAPTKTTSHHCPKCSAKISKGSKFCSHCGTALK